MTKVRNLKKKQESAQKIIRLLKKYYPDAHCALNYTSPGELLIATILSAQCTDKRVNIVTETLFKKYPKPQNFVDAPIKELEQDIHSTGFYKNKAKNIKQCCKDLVENYDGKVPKKLDQLVQLSGVGRKTANVVLGNAYNISSGVVVDTHVSRLSNRLGLVKGKNAQIIERELNEIISKKHWIMFSHWLIAHGREVCKARVPQCNKCFLAELCPSYVDK